MATIRSQATDLDLIVGVDRNVVLNLSFTDEAGDPVEVLDSSVTAEIARSTPIELTIAQGATTSDIALSVASGTLGFDERVDDWYLEVDGNEWLRGTWTVTNDTVETGDVDGVTVVTSDATVTVTVLNPGAGVATHSADTTAVHGITDTSALLDTGDVGASVQAWSAVLDATTASFTAADETKLDGIETAATADQSAGEIKTAYESNADTNAFTDADETKLDGIEASATADQTPAELLTAIKTVDGATSGLDADLLDGQEAAAFATAAQGALADTATQPGDLATVATSGDYDDLTNAPDRPHIHATDYGVVADGVTDDTTALVNAAAAAADGTLLLPAGTILVSDMISIPEDCHVQGMGRYGTVIKVDDNSDIGTSSASPGGVFVSKKWYDSTNGSQRGTSYDGFTIDGNKSNQTGGYCCGIISQDYWGRIGSRVLIQDTTGDGIRYTDIRRSGTGLTSTTGQLSENLVLDGVEIRNPDGWGIRSILDTGSNNCNDGMIGKVFIQNTGDTGIEIDRSAGWTIDGVHTYGCAKSSIIVTQPWDTHVVNTKCDTYGDSADAGTYYGIWAKQVIEGRGVFIQNNLVSVNGAATETRVGVRTQLQTSCVNTVCLVSNNLVIATSGTIATGFIWDRQSTATGVFVKSGNVAKAVGGTLTTEYTMTAGWSPAPQAALRKEVRIASPGSSENVGLFHLTTRGRIHKVHAVLVGSSTPSVTFNIRHNTFRTGASGDVFTSDQVCTNTTTGTDYTPTGDIDMGPGEHCWFTTSAQSGTVTEILVTVEYSIDA